MEKGDLSNDDVPRWIITLDVLTSGFYLPHKKLWTSWAKVARQTTLDVLINGQMHQARNRFPIIYEGACFGLPEEYSDALWQRLEDEGWLIRYWANYSSRNSLASALPYRPDVLAVIDLPEYVLQWGGRGRLLGELT